MAQTGSTVEWPDDADGDVMRRLRDAGFDFSLEAEVDFNIDFDRLPPDSAVIGLVEAKFPSARVSIDGDSILVQVRGLVTCDFVTGMQANLTQLSPEFAGRCESWGILA